MTDDPTGVEDTLRTPGGGGDPEHDLLEVDPAHYDVGEEFARGGIGRILVAKDRRLLREVAIKELMSRERRAEARFIREILITARLEHPNIVPVHEAGRWPNGQRFYAMKLVEGRTLSEALEKAASRDDRLSLLSHVIDVADAVAYAHAEGILHRDLKPSNVLVGAFGETVLIDWGLAKDLASGDVSEPAAPSSGESLGFDTTDGMVVGTPPYMSPEQAAAKPVSERSDVYAIGAMLYQVLSGHRPYEEVPPQEVLREVIARPPVPLGDLASDLPQDLLAIVAKAMARDAADRYPSAKELADELRRFSAGQLVRAHAYGPLEMAKRFARRQAPALATASLAVLLLFAGAVFSFVNIRAERNQARASAELARAQVQRLILEKARSMLSIDPTMALAWLGELAAPLPGAPTVAAEAVDRGVASHVIRDHSDRVLAVRASRLGTGFASGSQNGDVRWCDASGASRLLYRHDRRVSTVALSPDGAHIASGSHDRTVRLYDLATGDALVLLGHERPVRHVVFSPDGELLASSSEDGAVRLQRVRDGAEVRSFSSNGGTRAIAAAFIASSRALLVGGTGPVAAVYDLSSGRATALRAHRAPVTCISAAPRGDAFATASGDGVLRIWSDPATFVEVVASEAGLLAVAFAPDGESVAASGLDGIVRVFSLEGRIEHVLRGHQERVVALDFAAGGRRLASASWDKTSRVFDLESGDAIALLGHAELVTSVAFGSDGLSLATASWDRSIRLWPLPPPDRRVLPEHEIGVHSVDFSADGKLLASGGHDNLVRIYDAESGSSRALAGHTDHVYRVVFSPDGRLVASSSDDRTVRVWSVTEGSSEVLEGHADDVEDLAFSPDGRWLASAGRDARPRLWDVARLEGRVLEGHRGSVNAVAFDPSSRHVATAGEDRTVRIFAIDGGVVELAGHEGEVLDVEFRPDGRELASASVDGTVRIWSLAGELLHVGVGLGRPGAIAYSPDGQQIAVGGSEARICSPHLETCHALGAGAVEDIVFDETSRWVVTASLDHTVRLFDAGTLESHVFRGHRAGVFDVDIQLGNRRIASASGDADVRLWPFDVPPEPKTLERWIASKTRASLSEAK
jgi:WD40 repeat protein/tRNA A-37 threonylcarbamoyl transferase component Bud32